MQEQKQINIKKSKDSKLMQATFVVLAPDEVDAHGDTISEEEIRKACFNFNEFCSSPANLFHMTPTAKYSFAESYVAPVDFQLDDKFIKKGTWLATIQVKDEALWELIESGDINGVSVGCPAIGETL